MESAFVTAVSDLPEVAVVGALVYILMKMKQIEGDVRDVSETLKGITKITVSVESNETE